MGLISCPECGNATSERAEVCPKCGCPIGPSGGGGTAQGTLLTIDTPRGRTDFVLSEITAISFFQKAGWIKFLLLLAIGGVVLLAFALHPFAGIFASIYGIGWTATLFKSTGYIATTGDVTSFSVSWSGFERVVEDYKRRIGTAVVEVREHEGIHVYHHVINPARVARMTIAHEYAWGLFVLALVIGGAGFVWLDANSSGDMLFVVLGVAAFLVFLGFVFSHSALNVTSAGSHEFALRMSSAKANETVSRLRQGIQAPGPRRGAGNRKPVAAASASPVAESAAPDTGAAWEAPVPKTAARADPAPRAAPQWVGVLYLPTGDVREFRISATPTLLGRDAGCDIRVDDERISRSHLRLLLSTDGVLLEDLGSTNGTWLEGSQRIERHTVQPGDWFAVGGSRLVMEKR